MMNMTDELNLTDNFSIPVDPTQIFGPQRDSLYIVIPITIIYALIFVTGLFGNIFTCIVIIRNKSMHTATNYYLFSLAISDLLLLVSGMPQEMYSIWSKWPYMFGHSFCLIRGLAAETSTNASVLTITLFTIERYLAICHPFVSHKMSKLSRAVKHVMLLWIASFGLALPQALQFGIKSHQGVVMCLQTRVIIKHSFEISTFFFFFAPMVLITVLYSLIGLRLKQSNISKQQNEVEEVQPKRTFTCKIRRKHSQSTRRVVKMLVAVVVAFFVCWAPFHAQRLVAIYGTAENHLARSPILLFVYYALTYISGVFYYISTCINPIFYHIMSNKFREAFKNTMMQWCCRNKREQNTLQRFSYTAVAVSRQQHPNGNFIPGHSFRTNTSSRHIQTTRLDSSDSLRQNEYQWQQTCKICSQQLTTDEQRKHSCRPFTAETSLKKSLSECNKRDQEKSPQHFVVPSVSQKRKFFSICCSSKESTNETMAPDTPEPTASYSTNENKTEYYTPIHQPDKYCRGTSMKMRIIQRDKDCR